MHLAAQRTNRRIAFRPLAIAAAAALAVGAIMPAQAQSFTQSGANSTTGNPSGLPFVGNPASLDFGTDTIYIANGAPGSFSALAGAQLTAGALTIANGGASGSGGDVTFDGTNPTTAARTTVLLGGTSGLNNRLEVGNFGTGTLTVSGGALLDATVNAAAGCTICTSFIGTGAGSTATLNVSGAGSEVRTLGINIGISAVYTNPPSAFNFGTPGGTTNAFVNVLAGGKLTTERATVGYNTGSPNGNGSEKAFATVVVDGAGSQWLIKNNSLGAAGDQAAGLTIGQNTGGTGTVTVSTGGTLRVDGTGGPGPNDFLNIGGNGGNGSLTVTGAGSSAGVVGINPVINVGRAGSGATGSFSVLAGASASTLYMSVGRQGASGALTIDGIGSTLTQSGVGIVAPTNNGGPAFANIGRDSGTGHATVSGGGQWLISDGGGDGRASGSSPGIFVGRGTNSIGSLTITGAGSKVEITSTSLNPGAGVGDNYNPFVSIGYDNAATTSGTLLISNGGKLVMNGNALSTAANPRGTSLSIGGNGSFAGTGTATVTGAGSAVQLVGDDTGIQVGRSSGSVGSFSVLSGATASSVFLTVGRDGGNGSVLLDGGGTKLTQAGKGIYPTDGLGPAVALVGWGGTGSATVSNGAGWSITDGFDTSALPSRGPALYVGVGSGALVGNGALSISGAGSKVEIVSTSIAPIPGGADNFNPTVYVGSSAGSIGTVDISGGGKLLLTGNAISTSSFRRGTNLYIGGSSDTTLGGTGTTTVAGLGSELRVEGADGFIGVGFNGNGTLNLSNQALLATTRINVGRAASGVGTLSVDNSFMELSGQYTSDGTGAGFSVGSRGGNGTATITNNSLVTITNMGSSGPSIYLGGTPPNPLGHGELTVSGGSKINMIAAPGLASMTVGRDGSGIATITGPGSQIDLGDGTLHLAQLAGSTGTLTINSGGKVLAGVANIGGSSTTVAGGNGTATVSGAGSELRVSGPAAFIGVGRGGVGSLDVSNGGTVSSTAMTIGRYSGGQGTLTVNNSLIDLSGQQTAGNLVGANLAIGNGGGSGVATITNSSTVNITNYTVSNNAGANLIIGGSGNYPLGIGSLVLSGGSQINVLAAPGAASAPTLGVVTIGNDGTGTASLSGASSINVGAGNVYVARQGGSSGTLELSGNSVINAGFVGVGVGSAGVGNALGAAGGTATLRLNDSTINTSRFELGANGLLTGNNGVINVADTVNPISGLPEKGPVVIAGTVSPGNSPGRLRINCDVTMLAGSKLILEINDRDGGPGVDFDIDQLIIGKDSKFDLTSLQIIFSFIGNTNPNEFAASPGGFNLDKFLLAGGADNTISGGLSSLFGNKQNPNTTNWDQAVNSELFAFESSAYDVTQWRLAPDGEITIEAAAVPEPASIALVLLALASMALASRRRVARRVF